MHEMAKRVTISTHGGRITRNFFSVTEDNTPIHYRSEISFQRAKPFDFHFQIRLRYSDVKLISLVFVFIESLYWSTKRKTDLASQTIIFFKLLVEEWPIYIQYITRAFHNIKRTSFNGGSTRFLGRFSPDQLSERGLITRLVLQVATV